MVLDKSLEYRIVVRETPAGDGYSLRFEPFEENHPEYYYFIEKNGNGFRFKKLKFGPERPSNSRLSDDHQGLNKDYYDKFNVIKMPQDEKQARIALLRRVKYEAEEKLDDLTKDYAKQIEAKKIRIKIVYECDTLGIDLIRKIEKVELKNGHSHEHIYLPELD